MPESRLTARSTILFAFMLCGLLLLGACANKPLQKIAKKMQWEQRLVQTDYFLHNALLKPGDGELLHVYIEGDRQPWLDRHTVARDPGGQRALLTPQLMQTDSNQAVFLGRPCYFNTRDPACSAIWWTHQRYAEQIVNSMNAALSNLNRQNRKIVLIGHSGGGTLAWLMAQRRSDTVAVITLAANLDIQAWTEHHKYSALTGSLNPAELEPLSYEVLQRHYLGENDKVVNAAMLEAFKQRHPKAKLVSLPGVDHRCCWAAGWNDRLQRSLQSITQPKP